MKLSRLTPARIARSIVTFLVLTLIQTIAPPLLNIQTTQAGAAVTQGTITDGTAIGGNGGYPTAPTPCSNGAITGISVSSSTAGGYTNGLSFRCTPFNNDGSLGTVAGYTSVFAYVAVDTPQDCPAGQVGIGFRGRVGGSMVRAMALICGNPMSQASSSILPTIPSSITASGNTDTDYYCTTGKVLVSISGRVGNGADQITPRCATYTGFVYSAISSPTIASSGPHTASISFTGVSSNISDSALTYTVTAVPTSGTTITATGLSSPISLTGLGSNMAYTITVSGANSYGTSAATGSVTLSSAPLPGSDTDTALSFNGSTQYAEVADSTGSPFDLTGAITMEAWVKPADTCPNSGAVISKNVSYMMYCQSGKWMYMVLANGASGSGAATSISVDANAWHHLAYTKSAASGDLLIYYDGVLVQTIATGVTSMTPNNNVFRLGQYTGSFYFNGLIDEVHIYNTQRTQSQIATDMNTYGPVNDSALVAYYDFNEGTGSTLYNREAGATSATDLTLSGAPSWDATQIAPTTTYGPYTVQTFNRTYLTSTGGWKIPSNAKIAQYLIVAGGGAGGGSLMESHYAGGGGGAGGVRTSTTTLTSGYLLPIVGQGQLSTGCVSTRGSNSSLTGGGITAIYATGGGSGSCNASNVDGAGGIVGNSGGSGGGGGAQVPQLAAGSGNAGNYTPAEGFSGGASQPDSNSSFYQSGGGGGGAAVAGTNGTASRAGNGGAGRLSTILNGTTRYYGGGGGGGIRPGGPTLSAGGNGGGGGGGSTSATSGTANTGGGGGGCSYKICGSGGSGVIIIRWITATKPTYTPPVNAYLNVGQTETFTTNVATDSGTAVLTRTFRWESTTTGSGGTFSLIKQGTGAANAAFAWIPTDTSTTGSNYLYRVIVTDSDTAGLFIQDTSTPVFATINKTLLLSSKSSLTKTIGVTKTETFTVTFGTPTYTYSLTPVNPNFWLDTSTVGLPRINFADTVTVGTYYETFTVTDSVSASISVPLTITVSAPPSFSASSNMVDSGTVLYLDAGNSASYSGTGSSWNDLSGRGLVASLPPLSMPAQNSSTGLTCSTPTFSNTTTPNLVFNGTSTCGYVPNIGILPKYTYEVWFKRTGADSLMSDYSSMIASPFSGPGKQINITLHWRTNGKLVAGIWDGSNWIETTQVYVAANSWNYVAVTYDGLNLQLSLNGVTATKYSASSAITFTDALNDKGLLIGKRFDQNRYFFTGSIGSIRIYNRVLTDAEILQNYNATKDRFAGTLNENVIAKKYASRFVDTYTVTSGSESLTATFTNNALAGVKWDTSTARSIVLTLQDTLTPGTYYDTITATDIYGSSSRLPLTFTIAKADTLTVSMDTATVVAYNGSAITTYPRATIKGLKGSDTATSLTRFSSALYSESTVVPTNADTYTVRGATPTFTVGSLSYYEGVIYETSTATINKINQRALNIYMYGGVVGSPYLIYLAGGSGTGAVTETLTGLASLSGCAISNRYLTATEQKQGFCEVRVVKAGDQNYFAETQTVQLYFMAFISNQQTGFAGSGAGIGLNGVTSFETSTVQPPSITALSTLTLSLGAGGNFTITGTGFTGAISVKFWRNKVIDATSGNGTSIVIPVSSIASAGATSGRISVITSAGQAISVDSLTITP